jgi:hypothetical protein
MPYFVTIVTSGTISSGSAFGGLIGGFGVLVAIHLAFVREEIVELSIVLPSVAGLALSVAGLVFELSVLKYVAGLIFITMIAITAVMIWRESPRSSLAVRLPSSPVAKGIVITVALVIAVGIGFTIGFLIGDESPTVVAAPGAYHVGNTCYDGVCTVNVCRTHQVCGEENVGELREGTAIEIECQTKGGMANGSQGETSRIWDRLPSGYYISDLFVSETENDRFTDGIDRCTGA